jgi:hypothetical protein
VSGARLPLLSAFPASRPLRTLFHRFAFPRSFCPNVSPVALSFKAERVQLRAGSRPPEAGGVTVKDLILARRVSLLG